MDKIRISNDRDPPMCQKVFAQIIEHGPFPEPTGDRLLFVRPLKGETVLSHPRRVLQRMKVGDNAFFPVLPQGANGLRSRIAGAAKLQGFGITSRTDVVDGLSGLRIWRIS